MSNQLKLNKNNRERKPHEIDLSVVGCLFSGVILSERNGCDLKENTKTGKTPIHSLSKDMYIAMV